MFLLNIESLIVNMKEQSLVARRQVHDAVTALGGLMVCINKPLIHSVKMCMHITKKQLRNSTKRKAETLMKELEAKEASHENIRELNFINIEIKTLKQ
ncbi:hypothetical protein PR048_018627 [Dryococelus australis]|uniref:Uncharacterized protein n=1 Tax=Dryococelus australis TaxID=614101 RepID=A0ABQ9HCZ7_9NEOP|nr:hypothetical protein PR048_018627 [Dryococelus australis]